LSPRSRFSKLTEQDVTSTDRLSGSIGHGGLYVPIAPHSLGKAPGMDFAGYFNSEMNRTNQNVVA
jgi:hypothetical protein